MTMSSQPPSDTATGPTRAARPSEIAQIHALLTGAALPVSGVAERIEDFVVFDATGTLAGVGGLELYGRSALLRSLAVAPEFRGRGVGAAICDHLERVARNRGAEQLFILTETAETFFCKRGYVVTPRSEAPAEIASSAGFALLCPQSAVLMRRAA